MSAWTNHVNKWKDCTACLLCKQRDRIVIARGRIPADICFIGEAPGASEDAIGQPFVGPAGSLLDQIIERAIPATVRYVLTNLVLCFPREAKATGDNEPSHQEILACRPRLIEFVNIAQSRLIVCVGSLAASYIKHDDTIQCADIVHPAAILRMPLAQKQMAVQKTIVVLQNAVEDMLQKEYMGFKKWGDNYARISAITRSYKQQYRDAHDGPDIPF